MIKFKYKLVFFTLFLIFTFGIVFVNVQLNKMNGRAYEKSNYEGIYKDNEKKPEAYGEFVLDSSKNIKLRMYYNSPLDIKISLGNKIIYINTSFIDLIKKRIYGR